MLGTGIYMCGACRHTGLLLNLRRLYPPRAKKLSLAKNHSFKNRTGE
jgi:hypothetical protein